ncbi:5-oxoprolinase subunit B family protein [Deinococcus multiflagellatus]|uniref:5-oxoprolinase subunit B family protein n=1 Tax=Deinococcus multiflagellatus TaxID=1656887 RepID=UPI001CCF5CF2|nr:allophanate hydrolase subunit 1 [Deinococcus multiflagellatus]MBZ9715183.1 allophanate hydrolase subunit 1 [Deinococcus multiflagellatus]
MSAPTFEPLGDAALVVRTPAARALLARLWRQPPPGLLDAAPALGQVTLLFDPLHTDAARLEQVVRSAYSTLTAEAAPPARELTLPVTFSGPDLPWCAAHAGLSEAALVEALCALTFEVAFLGFTPGFAFLTGLPPALQMPRLAAPREQVPAGSVALGGPWAGVYPRATPGGWRLVGHTAFQAFDLSRPEPVPWRAGDRVRLEAQRG